MISTNPLFQALHGSDNLTWDPETGNIVRLESDGYHIMGYSPSIKDWVEKRVSQPKTLETPPL